MQEEELELELSEVLELGEKLELSEDWIPLTLG